MINWQLASPQATLVPSAKVEDVACLLGNSQSLESQYGLYSTFRITHSKLDLWLTNIITPRACTRGTAISFVCLSVCRCHHEDHQIATSGHLSNS